MGGRGEGRSWAGSARVTPSPLKVLRPKCHPANFLMMGDFCGGRSWFSREASSVLVVWHPFHSPNIRIWMINPRVTLVVCKGHCFGRCRFYNKYETGASCLLDLLHILMSVHLTQNFHKFLGSSGAANPTDCGRTAPHPSSALHFLCDPGQFPNWQI